MSNFHWRTPDDLYKRLAREFGPFDFDAAANPTTSKTGQMFIGPGSKWRRNALTCSWVEVAARLEARYKRPFRTAWCQPPYVNLLGWVTAATRAQQGGLGVAWLSMVDTSSEWFELMEEHAEIFRIKRRISYIGKNGKPVKGNRHQSIFALFRPPAPGIERGTGWSRTVIDPYPERVAA